MRVDGPARIAPVAVTPLAAPVVDDGAPPGPVVKLATEPNVVPVAFVATTR